MRSHKIQDADETRWREGFGNLPQVWSDTWIRTQSHRKGAEMSKITGGDWTAYTFQKSEDVRGAMVRIERPASDGMRANPDICEVFAIGDDGRRGGEMEANARLIAAAPELKDALADLVFDLAAIGFDSEDSVSGADAVEVICQHWKTLKAAIAQATGKGQK